MKIKKNGQWTCIVVEGDPKKPEPPHVAMIEFPGGNVNVTRTTDNKYWIHIHLNHRDHGFTTQGL